MSNTNAFFIKKRINPQFNKPYYIVYGKLTPKQVKKYKETSYGENIMLGYVTEKDFHIAIRDISRAGFDIKEAYGVRIPEFFQLVNQ